MKWTGLNELREKYLSFYESKEHLRLGSFPLVPKNDPSLLLINSGMAPMKKWFLEQEEPPCHRVTTCQKCIRTPDIERVGITARHGTFFEMLGNFSFQNYFKPEAIAWAWEFLTQVVEIPAEKLYISVYQDDDEAYDLWTQKIGIKPEHMVRLGKEDNFWEHGSGPCGPCSEIYFDRGEAYGCGKPTCGVGCDCDRYMEVWNLVFSQFDSDGQGTYNLLPRPNIDTGMGLERLACVMQGVGNLFEVDTVQAILHHVERISGKTYGADKANDISIRVITDHIRSTSFMVSDGVLPSNEGRGYVLRRLLRRAARHGRLLGIERPFLVELVDTVIEQNSGAYPELAEQQDFIKKVIGTEEERFYRTIEEGLSKLNAILDGIRASGDKVLSGADAFRLNDTFGFPIDLTKEIAAEAGIEVDEDGFHQEMKKQKETARKDRLSKNISGWDADLFGELTCDPTLFTGYDSLVDSCKVIALSEEDTLTDAVSIDDGAKANVLVVLDHTPFYAEMGGQVGDTGVIRADEALLKVEDVKKTPKGYFVHTCTLMNGMVKVGQVVSAEVDEYRRGCIARNHTGTHLLQRALRDVLGSHVHQAGSYVDDSRLRFDFTHFSAVTQEEISKIEEIVNRKIFESLPVTVQNLPIEEARKMGAMALFGEKYGDIVRVVDVNGWSTEFCGGTHVSNIAQIGCIKIISESSVAAGVRRIEATTGAGVLQLLNERTADLVSVADALKANNIKDIVSHAAGVAAHLKEVTKQLDEAKSELAEIKSGALLDKAADVEGIQVVSAHLSDASSDSIRSMCEKLTASKDNCVVALVASQEGKITLAIGCGASTVKQGVLAGKLIKSVAEIAGGKGGGKPNFAMAGLKDADKIEEALAAVPALVREMLH